MYTYENAPDQYVTVDGIRFAYRRLGVEHGVPLLLCMHYRGTMDHWDPALVNALAAKRPVLMVDNTGVGRTGGQIATSYADWAAHYVAVVRALAIRQVDIMGFSMGGAAAQMAGLNAPSLVRAVVLAGTFPSCSVRPDPGPFYRLRGATTPDEHRAAFLYCFFEQSETSQAAGRSAWERIVGARPHRVDYLTQEDADRQSSTYLRFHDPGLAAEGSYDRLDELDKPVLVATGKNDLMVGTENSCIMYRKLPNAQLHLYPDSGHGFLYQYAAHFSRLVNDFLDDAATTSSRL